MPQGADIASDPRREQGIDLYEQSNTTDGSNKVEWSIDAFNGTQTALYFRDHPYVELWIENTDSGSINWTLESSPTGSGNWSSVSSGSVGANSASKVYSNPVSDQYIRVDLDDTGHKVRLLGLADDPGPHVRADALEAEAESVNPGSGEQPVPLQTPGGASLTETVGGDAEILYVGPFDRLTIRLHADVNDGNDSATGRLKKKTTTNDDLRQVVSQTVSGGASDFIGNRLHNVEDCLFVQITDEGSDDNSYSVTAQ